MKIVLDPQIFTHQKYGGISRYYTEVYSVLSRKNNVDLVIPLYSTANIYFNKSVLINIRQKAYLFCVKILSKLRIPNREAIDKRNASLLRKVISKQKFDLFIPTYYDSYFIEYIGSKPFVLTVYDMIHELFPEYFIDDKTVVPNKRYLIEKATRIIAVSQNTKKDIIKIYPYIDESKIDVVYHGCSIKVQEKNIGFLPLKYILFVGTRTFYKNFMFLINSVSELLKNDQTLYLLCAGGGNFSSEENEVICKLGLKDQIIQKCFDDDELGSYYENAKCFVFPSKYEGFGIPVLESMACGCPVVLSNHSSFPEVAGDAGVYFELNNSEDLKNKIETLIQNETLRNEFSLKGLEQVKKFSWERAAEECFAVYRKACNNSQGFHK